jgi:hypothetical protein
MTLPEPFINVRYDLALRLSTPSPDVSNLIPQNSISISEILRDIAEEFIETHKHNLWQDAPYTNTVKSAKLSISSRSSYRIRTSGAGKY